jgi:hypothetical protein
MPRKDLIVQDTNTVGIFARSLGKNTKKTFIGWESINDCTNEDCPIQPRCPFLKRGKCSVQVSYLNHFYDYLADKYLTCEDDILFQVGMMLMPLYGTLIKLKMIEASLTMGDISFTTNRGYNIHPIYREIRETMKTIVGVSTKLDFAYSKFRPKEVGEILTFESEGEDYEGVTR